MDKKGLIPGIGGIASKVASHGATKAALGGAGGVAGSLAPKLGGMAGSIGHGLMFGLGMKFVDSATSNVVNGSRPFFLAVFFDALAFIFGQNPFVGLGIHALGAFFLIRQLPGEIALKLIYWSQLFSMIVLIFTYDFFTIFSVTEFIIRTLGNPFFPILSAYISMSGFIVRRESGKFMHVVNFIGFFILVSLFITVGRSQLEIALDNVNIDSQVIEEQEGFVKVFAQTTKDSVGETSIALWTGIKDAPQNFASFLQDPINAKAQFGEEKDNAPPMGVRIHQLNPGVYRFTDGDGDHLTFRVELEAQALPDGERVVRITNAWCDADGLTGKPVKEFEDAFEAQQKIEMFLNTPLTVSCTFSRDELEPYDGIEFHVQYELTTNAQRKSYAMRDDLWSDLRRNGEDPFTYMGVRASSGDFVTRYDAGPIKVGIGPEEFGSPPIPIGTSAPMRSFEVLIGNDKAFSGEIAELTDIRITLPAGISLSGEYCDFKEVAQGLNVYQFDQNVREFNIHRFTTISGQEIFSCPMEIDNSKVLGSASFAELAFDVNIDAVYETTAKVSKRRQGLFD